MNKNKDFYAGIISALAIVKLHNADTIHSEIVALCDVEELLAHARAEGEIEFAGLGEYECIRRTGRCSHSNVQKISGVCYDCGEIVPFSPSR